LGGGPVAWILRGHYSGRKKQGGAHEHEGESSVILSAFAFASEVVSGSRYCAALFIPAESMRLDIVPSAIRLIVFIVDRISHLTVNSHPGNRLI
jgi:hypothetical protein